MTTPCSICLEPVDGNGNYHSACLAALFGTTALPTLDIELAKLYTLAATKMAGKMSVSGTQPKVSLDLSPDKSALDVAESGGRYILKPDSSRFSSIPQNEQLTMRMAQLLGIEVPPFGLIQLKDDTTAYVVKRFDRLDDGSKLQVEDFCQLTEKQMKDKYDGSAELCVKTVRKFASEPLIEIQKLYRLFLFCWWTQNGDMHLKNFSMITTPEGIRRLSPAYDLVCTKLVIPDDTLALPIGGRDKHFTRRKWFEFAEYCGLPERAAKRLIAQQIDALESAEGLIAASSLPDDMKQQYEEIVRENTAVLCA